MSGEALVRDKAGRLRTESGGIEYPVVDGVAVLLPLEDDRTRVACTEWGSVGTAAAAPLDFYNQTRDHDLYCREELPEERENLRRYVTEALVTGPTLELGSGKGSLQGIGPGYVALDVSLTALRTYVDRKWQRVCASAEALPFFDSSFGLIFSVATIEHVSNPAAAFHEIRRVLRPGGIAFLQPAWHCVQYNCEGIPVRPYADLTPRQKAVKASLPLRRNILVKSAVAFPQRAFRRAVWAARGRGPTTLEFRRLRPDYTTFWMSDSDACSRIDYHEGCLFFQSRGDAVLGPAPSAWQQMLARHGPLIVRKARGG